jgi:hypothetical protein
MIVLAVVAVTLLAVGLVGYYETGTGKNTSSQNDTYFTTTGTGKSAASETNTYLTSCVVTGVGGFEFRIVSDSTGATVSGETIRAVDRAGCNAENQVVYLDSFSESQGGSGWLVPDWPGGATPAGQLSFTISYQGGTYNFTADIPPIGTDCATFHVPSGSATSTTVMNGSGSYCS